MTLLDNEGSTARDHLANERTFLAWVRTALGTVGLGVVLERLVGRDDLVTSVAGATLVLYGAGMIGYALLRYEHVARLLRDGRFAIARRGPAVIGALALLLALAALVLVLET